MLVVSDLRVAYGRIEVVHGISFEAKAGEVTCLIGPNGAGKSTTLWTLSGILRPTAGACGSAIAISPGSPPPTSCNAGCPWCRRTVWCFPT